MELKHKMQFELLNNSLWLLLKGYVKNDKPYKDVMSDVFKIYIRCDSAKDKYSDDWWESTGDLYDVIEKYKGQEVCSFGADLADNFYEYLRYKERNRDMVNEDVDFYKYVCESFLTEWGRLRDEKT